MKRIALILMVIAVLALVLVGACGGDNGEEKTTATTTAATSAATTTKTTQPSNGGGGGFTWNDVPIYGGADQIQEFSMSFMPEEDEDYSKMEWRYYETGDDVDDVVDFYKDKMPDNGWDEQMWADMGEIAYGM
jgi:ABC-type phosphate/phosphonate transport system substrate-binding protein